MLRPFSSRKRGLFVSVDGPPHGLIPATTGDSARRRGGSSTTGTAILGGQGRIIAS